MTVSLITLPRGAAGPIRRDGKPSRRSSREFRAVFAAAAVLYLAVGFYLATSNVTFADAYSREANAFYVLYSRDPHLPALGFVWNPLPSLALLPILPLKSIFPYLVTHAFAGVIQSALSMAAAVAVINGCLRKLGVQHRGIRLAVTSVLAIQPIILLYGGSGQSEPMLLLTLAITTSALVSWTSDRRPGQLVLAGVGLGLGYLTRYETVASAVGVVALVAVVSIGHARGPWLQRIQSSVNDVLLVVFPILFSFALWAAASKVVTGQWFPTFSSDYGNSAQVAGMAPFIEQSIGTTPLAKAAYVARQTFWLSPVFAVLAGLTIIVAIRRRSSAALVAPTVFGAVMAFSAIVAIAGSSFAWIRFQIAIVPLTALLAGTLIGAAAGRLPPRLFSPGAAGLPGRTDRPATPTVLLTAGVAIAAMLVALPAQMRVLTDDRLNLAREEAPVLQSLYFPQRSSYQQLGLRGTLDVDRRVAADIDEMNLPDGSVLGDSTSLYPVILNTDRPTVFVVTSDRDFQAALAEPSAHSVGYLLVSSNARSDSVQQRYPTLYLDGAGIATLSREWANAPWQTWRLYRVD